MAKNKRPNQKRARAVMSQLGPAKEAFDRGDFDTVRRLMQPIVTGPRPVPEAWYLLGIAEMHSGRFVQALTCYQNALKARPRWAEVLVHMGCVHRSMGQFDQAYEHLEKARSIEPNDGFMLGSIAETMLLQKRIDEARELLEPAIQRGNVHPSVANAYGKLCLRDKTPERAIDVVREVATAPGKSAGYLLQPMFLLGELLDKAGRHDEAFEVYNQANKLKDLPFSPHAHTGSIKQLISNWSADRIGKIPSVDLGEFDSSRMIFIVGMPRSGTSLIEQILSSLEGVHGGGEMEGIPFLVYQISSRASGDATLLPSPTLLTELSIRGAATSYLKSVDQQANGARRVTDKMPNNFRHLGFIQAVLPGAKIIHCTRDPIDTCVSCYFQNFGSGLAFPYDLGHLGSHYNDYRMLMAHWHDVLPNPIFDLAYEDVVSNPEPTIRGLLEYLGLEWDDACLEFHKSSRVTMTASNDQVRQPLYTSSVERWRKYEKHLGPLFDAIDPKYAPKR